MAISRKATENRQRLPLWGSWREAPERGEDADSEEIAMSKSLSPKLETDTPYTPGEQPQDQQYIKLNTNESPYLPSPAVVSEHEVEKLRLYSDPACADLLKTAAAQKYGDQCVVLSADVKRVNGQFRVFAKGGREDTGRDALEWISWCVAHGAGEICLNSIDTDGVRTGFDLEMLDAVAARVNVPIIASGGAGKKEDFLELFHHKGIDAGLAAGIFHQKLLTIHDLKTYLNENGVEMRL